MNNHNHKHIGHSTEDVAEFHHPTGNDHLLCLVPSKAHLMFNKPYSGYSLDAGMGICLHPLSPCMDASSETPVVLFDITQIYSFPSAAERDSAASKLTDYNIKYDSRALSFIPDDNTQYVYLLLEVNVN